MKKISLLFALLVFGVASLLAQVPQKFSWQGIARDAAGTPITAPLELRFTISQGASAVFTEQTALTPNAFGLVVWNIGEKETAAFAAIDWAAGVKTLNVELRTTVGSGNFTTVGTEELKSVPYALVAGKALADQDNQTLDVNGNTLSIAGGNTVTLPVDGDGSPTNEIQTLSLTGQTLSLSNGGGTVTLPAGTAYTGGSGINVAGNVITNTGDADNNPANEIQTLSLNGQTLSLSNGGGAVTLPPEAQTLAVSGQDLSISGGNTVTLPADGDGSPTNEIQALSLTGQTLSLSNGGGSVALPPDNDAQTLTVNGLDLSISGGNTVMLPASTDNQTLEVNGQSLSISGGNTVTLPTDGDGSSTNEIQQLSLVNDSLSLSHGGGLVILKDASATNEIQKISLAKDSLTLSQGGGLVILKDTSSTNEIQTLTLTGANLALSKGGGSVTVHQAGNGITISNNNTIAALDISPINELQTLSISGNQLSLTPGGGTVTLPIGGGYWTGSGANIHNTNGGNVGIGTPSPNAKLDVAGDLNLNTTGIAMTVSNSEAIWYNGYYSWGYGGFNNYFNSVVSILTNVCCWALEVDGAVAKPGGGTWSALSDIRYKQDVQPYTDGLESVLKINPVRYHYNERSGHDTAPEYVGVIAQELRPVAPYMVMEMPAGKLNGTLDVSALQANAGPAMDVSTTQPEMTTDTYLSVDNSAMIYMLINAVKEQQAQIQRLEARIVELEKRTPQPKGNKQ